MTIIPRRGRPPRSIGIVKVVTLALVAVQLRLSSRNEASNEEGKAIWPWDEATSFLIQRADNLESPRPHPHAGAEDGKGRPGYIYDEKEYPFTFSACLLVKDDNKILPEWLAYHYTTLPLRHLVLAIDPFSLTSPEHILNDWRELGMRIDVWWDEDYMRFTDQYPKVEADDSDDLKFRMHFFRQNVFMSRCLSHLKRQNRTWTLLPDSDEYAVFNKVHEDQEDIPWECQKEKKKNGREAEKACVKHMHELHLQGLTPRSRLPEVSSMTAAEFMHSEMVGNKDDVYEKYPCIMVPRLQFGGRESSREEVSQKVPSGFDGSKFHTMSFRTYSRDHRRDKPGKSMVDASRFDDRNIYNPHRVMSRLCRGNAHPAYDEATIRIQHYTGSFEVFASRPGDPHRTKAEYDFRNNFSSSATNDDIRPWLEMFVKQVGHDTAKRLTQDAKAQAFIDDTRVNEEVERTRVKNRRMFINYTSSPWEQLWLDNIITWEKEKSICKQLHEQKAQLHQFLWSTCNAVIHVEGEQYCVADDSLYSFYYKLSEEDPFKAVNNSPPRGIDIGNVTMEPVIPSEKDASVLSKFVFQDEETGEQYTEYIEPLVGILRHPLAKCWPPGQKEGRMGFRAMLSRTHLIPIPGLMHYTHNETKNYYFDAGASDWNTGKGGPSLSTFTHVWKRHGIEFDQIYAWEGSRDVEAFNAKVPQEFKGRVEFNKQWIGGGPKNHSEVPFLPKVIKERAKKKDYVMFKLDIDNGPLEVEIADHLVFDGNNYLEYIDEFFWEHHVTGNYLMFGNNPTSDKKTLRESYGYFLKMRKRGVRAHSYV